MMKNWIKMKQKEIKCKLILFSMLEAFMEEKKEIAQLAGNLYTSLKDTPAEEMQDKLIAAIAALSHVQTNNEHEG